MMSTLVMGKWKGRLVDRINHILAYTSWCVVLTTGGFTIKNLASRNAVSQITTAWRWFSKRNGLSLVYISQIGMSEASRTLIISIPYLVHWTLAVDGAGSEDSNCTEWSLNINRKSICLRLNFDYLTERGYEFNRFFEDFFGEPELTIERAYPTTAPYDHPAAHGYEKSLHQVELTYVVRRWKYKQFWKRDKKVEGFEVRVEPPLIYRRSGHTGKPYSARQVSQYFAETRDPYAALSMFREYVNQLRETFG